MRIENFIMDGTNNSNDDINRQIQSLGANCCPTDNNVLGEQATRMIEVDEVLGIAEGNTLVEICIPIIPAGIDILENMIEKRIIFDALVASNGKVFINGRLIKKIFFVTPERQVTPTTGNVARIVLGNVRSVIVEVIFAICISIKEAVVGTRVVVLETKIDQVNLPNLRCPEQPLIRSLVEKDCINVRVKVVRDTIISVPITGTGV